MLRIGTDCSGIEAPIQALKNLKTPFKHIFSSEINKHCIRSINANYSPEIIYGDISARDISTISDIDIYVCGFPCQPFSQAGSQLGFNDIKGRGNIFFSCLEVIKAKKPIIFILENVKGLTWHNKKETFKIITNHLSSLNEYEVSYKVLNTKHYNIPQNRERIFFVGLRKDRIIKKFKFPKRISSTNYIQNYIDESDNNSIDTIPSLCKTLKVIPYNSIFIDACFHKDKFPNSNIYAPCLNASGRLWNVPKSRYANIKELLRLQGFPEDFKQVVSNAQLKKQIGNSISVNVLEALFKACFESIKPI